MSAARADRNLALRGHLRSGMRLHITEPEMRFLTLVANGSACWSEQTYANVRSSLWRKGLITRDEQIITTTAGDHVIGLAHEAGIFAEVLADELAIRRARRAAR
jgi:hypothetical protein